MKLAISIFQNRVSPVFDWSTRILVVESDEDREISREYNNIGGTVPTVRANQLEELSIHVLICGGISAPMITLVKNRNIRVIAWVAGDVEKVLKAFLEGRLPGKGFAMPGCCGRRWRRGGGNGERCR